MNQLGSVDIFCMSEHPKRISSHEVTASQIHGTHMYHSRRQRVKAGLFGDPVLTLFFEKRCKNLPIVIILSPV